MKNIHNFKSIKRINYKIVENLINKQNLYQNKNWQ